MTTKGRSGPTPDGPARLPPTIESANEQLLAQAPSLMQDLVPDPSAAHSHGVSATVEELPDHQSVLKLHVPAAVDSDASPSLCDAVSLYVNGRCKQDFQAGVAEDGMVCVRLRANEKIRRPTIDAVLAEVRTLVSVVKRLGGDAHVLAGVLAHPKAHSIALLFNEQRGASVAIFEVGNRSVSDSDGVPRPVILGGKAPFVMQVHIAQTQDVLDAAAALAGAGLHAEAIDLMLAQLWNSSFKNRGLPSSIKSLYRDIAKCLLKGKLDAVTTAEILHSVALVSHFCNYDFFLGCEGTVLEKLCHECEPPRLLALAELMWNAFEVDTIAPMLEAVFRGAIERGDQMMAARAIVLLDEMESDDAAQALQRCLQHPADVKAWPVSMGKEFRKKLAENGFEFRIKTRGYNGLVLVPLEECKFVPHLHANDLISHVEVVIGPVANPALAVNSALPVLQFLQSQLPQLNQEQKRRVDIQCDSMAKVLRAGIPSTGSDVSDPVATATRLHQPIAFSLLKSALGVLEGASDAEREDTILEAENAARWLLQNRTQLFGKLSDASLRAMLAEAGFWLPEGLDPEPKVDAASARRFLQRAIAPAVERLAGLFKDSHLARSTGAEHPSLTCWMTLAGTDDVGCLTTLVQGMGRTTMTSDEQWRLARSLYRDAHQALKNAVKGGKADMAGLVRLHKALIDSIVSMCRSNAKGSPAGQIIDWGLERLAEMSEDQALLKSLCLSPDGHPNAVAWPVMGGVQVHINRVLSQSTDGPGLMQAAPTADIARTLEDCAYLPGVTLDASFHAVIGSAIAFQVDRGRFDEAFSVLRLLYGPLVDRKEPGLRLSPIDAQCLLRLMADFIGNLPSVMQPSSTMVALMSALIEHSPRFALRALERACDAGLSQNAPGLACIGFLHLANDLMARGEKDDMLNAFVRALAHFPKEESWRSALNPHLDGLFKKLQDRGENDLGEILLKEYAGLV